MCSQALPTSFSLPASEMQQRGSNVQAQKGDGLFPEIHLVRDGTQLWGMTKLYMCGADTSSLVLASEANVPQELSRVVACYHCKLFYWSLGLAHLPVAGCCRLQEWI